MQHMTREEVAREAAQKAGTILKNGVPTEGIVEKEGQANIVTATDLASEKLIIELILRHFPQDAILSEETESKVADPLKEPKLWVIDPIDGTNNFRFGRNYSAVSIAYMEHGVSQIGAVCNPFTNEVYFAKKGNGAFLNGVKMQVSQQKDLLKASVGTGNQYDPQMDKRNIEILLNLPRRAWILIRGSAVLELSDLAAGKIDLFFHNGMRPWDMAAAYLFIEEAGGVIKDFNGNKATIMTAEKGDIVCGNEALVDAFLEAVNQ